jgi:DNA-binding protein HU-beta
MAKEKTGTRAPAKKAGAAKPAAKTAKAAKVEASDKDALVAVVQSTTGSTGTAAKATVAAIIETITKSIKKTGKFQLVGFGTFTATKRKARTGVNPQTGEKIKIAASKGVRFKPGTKLKASL